MTTPDDPFTGLPDDVFGPSPLDSLIMDGATVIGVGQHPIRGVTYRCRCWSAHYPWRIARGAAFDVYRGTTRDAPHIGQAKVDQIGQNGAGFREIAIGFAGDEVTVDLTFDVDLPIEVGDTLAFDRSGRAFVDE